MNTTATLNQVERWAGIREQEEEEGNQERDTYLYWAVFSHWESTLYPSHCALAQKQHRKQRQDSDVTLTSENPTH